MRIREKLYKRRDEIAAKLGLAKPQVRLGDFVADDAEIAALRQNNTSAIWSAFFAKEGRAVHKWSHYLPIYQKYFDSYRGQSMTFLEIGVLDGGSLDFWRRYFGAKATIVGIDLNPECANRVTPPNIVRIGSQADEKFLAKVSAEFGPFDIILDDGSHIGLHQTTSFRALFPCVKPGGIYAIEDTHTSYWPDHYGGIRRPTSAIEFGKALVDEMHGWYHHHAKLPWARSELPAVHFYDSVIIFEKNHRVRPAMIVGGNGG